MSDVIYLDNNATTAVAPEVLEKILPYYKEAYGNPSSMHTFGGHLAHDIKRARAQVASMFNSLDSEILFTSCGTESDNAAIRGVLEAHPDKRHIITSKVEHPAVLSLCQHLEHRGYQVTYLGVNKQGQLDLNNLREAIRPDTALVSIMYANNKTGTIFPVDKIGQIVKERGVVYHCDAVQAPGKVSMDMSKIPADLVSISGHKLHAPKGVGALYIRRGTRFVPFIIGGHQEHGRRGGTENIAGIVALGEACDLIQKHGKEERTRLAKLRDDLQKRILETIPETSVNGDIDNRLVTTTNISFAYIEGEAILLKLNEKGICASSGSACTSGSLEPSHVLRAMGVPFTRIHGSIRFSFSRYNTAEEVEKVLKALPPIIENLRNMSPFWSKFQKEGHFD